MKKYIKPSATVTHIIMETSFMTVSGDGNTRYGGSNGNYTDGVTLGSRRGNWDDEDDEEY